MIVSRFAPSPTGRLHLGHAFSAIRAHDLARRDGGRFLLRIEDIDPGRCREDFVAGIEEDLRWLGLAWDGPAVRQSARLPLHAAALDRLRADGLVYPCFCTRADIARAAAAPQGEAVPVYPGTCRGLPLDAERLLRQPHCWRLDVAKALSHAKSPAGAREKVSESERGERDLSPVPPHAGKGGLWWRDEAAGWVRADPAPQGDVVLARKDAPVSYHLAVTVDDAAQDVSDIVRGVDLFAATHVHRLLQAVLGLPTPLYHHHPLLHGPDGIRLAKRHGSPSLADLRARGADPVAIVAMLRGGRLPIGFAAGTS